MNGFEPDPPRWKDRAGQANLAERTAGRLVRAIGAPPLLSDPQLARIEAATRERQRRPGLLRWWPAMAVALLVSGATFALAARLDLMPRWLRPSPAAWRPAPPARKSHFAHAKPSWTSTPVQTAPAPTTEPPPTIQPTVELAPPSEAPVRARRATPPAPLAFVEKSDPLRAPPPSENRRRNLKPIPTEPAPASAAGVTERPVPLPPAEPTRVAAALAPAPLPAAPVPSAWPTLAQGQSQPVASGAGRRQGGARWLAEALHSLRANHAPGAALALLDLHAAELTQSAFVHEAMVLRVEALLGLKRSGEALALLDGKSLSDVAASRTLLLTRAELRAAAGRCADSLPDFDLVLARSHQPDEQALYGRALCRSRIGDKLGAHADFALYQRQFPNGPHIHDVEKQLAPL
jgi:hypothetical protein